MLGISLVVDIVLDFEGFDSRVNIFCVLYLLGHCNDMHMQVVLFWRCCFLRAFIAVQVLLQW